MLYHVVSIYWPPFHLSSTASVFHSPLNKKNIYVHCAGLFLSLPAPVEGGWSQSHAAWTARCWRRPTGGHRNGRRLLQVTRGDR